MLTCFPDAQYAMDIPGSVPLSRIKLEIWSGPGMRNVSMVVGDRPLTTDGGCANCRIHFYDNMSTMLKVAGVSTVENRGIWDV